MDNPSTPRPDTLRDRAVAARALVPDAVDHLPEVAPVLEADGLLLRPWTYDDAEGVLVLADDPESRRWSPSMRTLHGRDDALRWIDSRLARRTDWAVIDPSTGRLAGRVGLHHHDRVDVVAEIGYGVSPAFRRQGVVSRAVEATVGYAFRAAEAGGLGLHRVVLHHAVDNLASCRTAWSCGFAPEGTAREGLADGSGSFDDMHMHARLATDPPGPVPRMVPAEPVEIAAGSYQLCVPDPDRDAAAVAAAGTDPLLARWNAGPTTLEEARAWCLHRADWSDGTHASWVVREAVGGRLLGSVSLFSVDAQASAAQVGYWVVPEARGRGVAPTALAAATRFAYGVVGVERVELFHAVENTASCRVAEKVGFLREGVHRRSHRYGDGMIHDEHCHARLAGDPDPG